MNATALQFYHILYHLDIVASLAGSLITLVFSYRAYKHTKFRGFAFWSFACLLTLWNVLTMYFFGHDTHNLPLARVTIFSYRIILLFDSTLYIVGTIMVIREFCRMFDAHRGSTSAPLLR